MQNKSLVIVLPTGLTVGQIRRTNEGLDVKIEWLPIQDERVEYTVRRVFERHGENWVLFEEGVIGTMMVNGYKEEVGLHIRFVREVQPPEEVQLFVNNIMKEFVPFELV